MEAHLDHAARDALPSRAGELPAILRLLSGETIPRYQEVKEHMYMLCVYRYGLGTILVNTLYETLGNGSLRDLGEITDYLRKNHPSCSALVNSIRLARNKIEHNDYYPMSSLRKLVEVAYKYHAVQPSVLANAFLNSLLGVVNVMFHDSVETVELIHSDRMCRLCGRYGDGTPGGTLSIHSVNQQRDSSGTLVSYRNILSSGSKFRLEDGDYAGRDAVLVRWNGNVAVAEVDGIGRKYLNLKRRVEILQ